MKSSRWTFSLAPAMLVMATAAPVTAQPAPSAKAAEGWTVPRTEWGDPDVRGMWPLDSVGQTPMQRPERYGTQGHLTDEEYEAALERARELQEGYETEQAADKIGTGHWFERGAPLRQTSLIMEPTDGRIPPMTEEGKRGAANMKSSWSQDTFDTIADFNSLDRCITRGLPASMVPFPYNNGVEIFQSPGYVVLRLEMIHETRIIPVDGRPQLPASMTQWLGSSRGRWDGNTLVIETTNFNGGSPMVIVGPSNEPIPTSKSLKMVEHLTPTGPDTIRYEAWVEDPEVLTAPFKLDFPWTRNEDYEIFEYACNEGNTVIPGYIRATSARFADERAAALNARQQGQ